MTESAIELRQQVEALPPAIRRLWLELAKTGEAPAPPPDAEKES